MQFVCTVQTVCVQTAFLNAKLEEDAYTKQAPDFERLNAKLEEDAYNKQAPAFERTDDTGNRPSAMKLRKSLDGLR